MRVKRTNLELQQEREQLLRLAEEAASAARGIREPSGGGNVFARTNSSNSQSFSFAEAFARHAQAIFESLHNRAELLTSKEEELWSKVWAQGGGW